MRTWPPSDYVSRLSDGCRGFGDAAHSLTLVPQRHRPGALVIVSTFGVAVGAFSHLCDRGCGNFEALLQSLTHKMAFCVPPRRSVIM